MRKRSGAGHYNQTRRSWTRAKHKRACAWRLQQPHYVHLRLDTKVLEIELRPPVPIRDAASAFERFRGWLIRTVLVFCCPFTASHPTPTFHPDPRMHV